MWSAPLLLVAVALSSPSEPPDEPQAMSLSGEAQLVGLRLDDGLQVSSYADPRLAVVATQHWVDLGAVHEQHGQHGYAHLFEHTESDRSYGLRAILSDVD